MPNITPRQLAQTPHGRTLAGMAGAPLDAVSVTPSYSLNFNGSSTFVNVPDIGAIHGAAALTVAQWIYLPVVAVNLTLASKWDFQTQGTFLLQTGQSSANQLQAVICTSPTDDGTGCTIVTTNANLLANRWFHVALVFDGSQSGTTNRVRIYLNGNLLSATVSSGSAPATLTAATASLKFGRIGGTLTRYWNGLQSLAQLWTRALSAAELQALALHGPDAVSTTGLQGFWRFDDLSGAVAPDSSGNGNTGTITAGAISSNVPTF